MYEFSSATRKTIASLNSSMAMTYYYATKPTWKIVTTDGTCSVSSCCFYFFSNVTNQHSKTLHFTNLTHIIKNKCTWVIKAKGNDEAIAHVKEKKNDNAQTTSESVQIITKRPFWKRVLFASKKIRSIFLLNVITIVYASDIPVLKAVEEIMHPASFCAVRFVMSAIPFLPFVFWARDDVKTRNAGIELGLWVSLGYFVEALGLLTSDAGRASFISLFTVIVVPLFDGMLGAIIPAHTWFGVLISALGVGRLECSGSSPSDSSLFNITLASHFSGWRFFELFEAIFFGIHMLQTERISRSTKKENFLPLLGYEICVVALLSTIWVLVGGWFDSSQDFDQSLWTWTMLWDWMVTFPWVPALYTGIFSTGICLWIEIAAMRDVSATETAIIYGLQPLWGAGFAWFLLGERWSTAGWIGAALVLGGSLLVQMYGSSSPDKSLEAEECTKNGSLLLIPGLDKEKLQNNLSATPVAVRSKKDMTDMLK